MTQSQNNPRGIVFILLGMATFSIQDALIKFIYEDVACLMPTKDSPNQITAMVAASIMFEIICLISVYRNK